MNLKFNWKHSLVQQFGYEEVDAYLKELVKELHLKTAAREILQDLKEINLENDSQWQSARKR